MLGLVAIIAHDRVASVNQDEVEELADAYEALRGASRRRRASAGDYGRAITLTSDLGDDPSEEGSSWVMTAGVPHSLTASHPAHLEELEGQFAWISYDSATDEVSVASDPFGMFALYLARRDKKTYIATSALVLAKHLRAKPSRFGLQIFLRAGYHFGGLTNWEGIERIEPATRIVFRKDGACYQTYWRPEIDPAVATMGFEESVRYCNEVASATCAQVLGKGDRIWADLSGGFDTRLLSLLLRNAGVEFQSNTTGDHDSVEVSIARRIAQLGGWEWRQLTLPDDWGQVVRTIIPTSVAWSDGNLDALQLSRVLWGHREKSRTNRRLLIGGGGEHFRNFTWQQEFLNAGRSIDVNLDNWINMRLLHPMDTSLFIEDPTDNVRSDFRKRMLAWASPYSSELNTTQLDVMYAYKVTGHFGAYLSSAGAFVDAQLPFYWRPVFSAAFSTNYRYRNNHRLMRHMIAALDPRIAAVDTANGGPAEPWRPTNLHRFLPYYLDVSRRGLNKLTLKTTGHAVFRGKKAPDHRIISARRTVLEQLTKKGALTSTGMRAGRLFKPAALDGFVERALRPDFTGDELLGRIITIELTLETTDASLDE
jgi:Glutamine amidotransferase domain